MSKSLTSESTNKSAKKATDKITEIFEKHNLILEEETLQAIKTLCSPVQVIFLTGGAGTGKSTLLQAWKESYDAQMVVLAPTGVAALNVGGQTIHSFFRVSTAIQTEEEIEKTIQDMDGARSEKRKQISKEEPINLFKELEILIIDEISMVRADLLHAVDMILRKFGSNPGSPFGGVKMVLVGDLFQLPPVVTAQERQFFYSQYRTEFFFGAPVIANQEVEIKKIELTKVYRQSNAQTLKVLNNLRIGQNVPKTIQYLNQHNIAKTKPPLGTIVITTINQRADEINQEALAKLNTPMHQFTSELTLHEKEWIEKNNYKIEKLVPDVLNLKVGAQVMLLCNLNTRMGLVNGQIGIITEIEADQSVKVIFTHIGIEESVKPYAWEYYGYTFDPETKKINPIKVATYRQIPLRLGYAISVHKSQGKTFETFEFDRARGCFAHGQLYTALSRGRSIQKVTLTAPLAISDSIIDQHVLHYYHS